MSESDALLSPYKVVDLTNNLGWWMCGKLFADMGAEVIKVEPVGGDTKRSLGPFYNDDPNPDNSLPWWFQNRGKKSITLDIETEDGRQLLYRLLEGADLLVQSFDPGYMGSLGLGYEDLKARFPKLTYTSISPFGQTGPYAGFKGSDLVVDALGGFMYLAGDEDRAPIRFSVPQFYENAATESVSHSIAAIMVAQQTGQGQHVDVSAQLATIRFLMNASPYPILEKENLARRGQMFGIGLSSYRAIYETNDGHLTVMFSPGVSGGKGLNNLRDWAAEHVEFDDEVAKFDWTTLQMAEIAVDQEKGVILSKFSEGLVPFFKLFSKFEIYEKGIKLGAMIAYVSTTEDIYKDDQLEARGYFTEVDYGDKGSFLQAHHWAMMSETPLAETERAPKVGEHNREIYIDRLGISNTMYSQLLQAGVI